MAEIKLFQKSKKVQAGSAAKRGDPAPASYALQDNQDGSFTLFGVDASGAQTDISAVATLTPAPISTDTTVLTVDAPAGMTVACHGVKPGAANVACTAVWADGSVGPFSITVVATVGSGPVTGLGVTFTAPTIR